MPTLAEQVLTEDAATFLTGLQREFGPRRRELLAARHARAQRLRDGELPDFLPETQQRPRGRLAVAPRPGRPPGPPRRDHRPGRPQDGDQRAQLGREDVHGRLRGLQLADLAELHRGPGQPDRRDRAHDHARHGREAVRAERRDRDAARAPARLAPRGAALRGRRRADLGAACSTSACTSSATTTSRRAAPSSTCRSSSRTCEARLWNDVFVWAQDELGMPRGTIKATVLIETILAAFEMDEILYELREHSAGPERRPLGLHLQRDQEARPPARVRAPRPHPR